MISTLEIHVYEFRIEKIVYDPVSFKRYVVARKERPEIFRLERIASEKLIDDYWRNN